MSIRPWGKLSEYDPTPAMVDGPDILIADDGRVFVGDVVDLQLACRGSMFLNSATTPYATPSIPMVVDQGSAFIEGIYVRAHIDDQLVYTPRELAMREYSARLKILMPNDEVVTRDGVPYRKKVSYVGEWSVILNVIKTGASETLWLHHIDHPKAPVQKALDWLRRPLELRVDHVTTLQEKMQRLCRRFDMYLISRITKAAKRNGHVFFEGYEHYLA